MAFFFLLFILAYIFFSASGGLVGGGLRQGRRQPATTREGGAAPQGQRRRRRRHLRLRRPRHPSLPQQRHQARGLPPQRVAGRRRPEQGLRRRLGLEQRGQVLPRHRDRHRRRGQRGVPPAPRPDLLPRPGHAERLRRHSHARLCRQDQDLHPRCLQRRRQVLPPSQGSFRGDLQPVVRQILEFLSRTDSYFMVNLYPYITYRDNYPKIPLDYTLGRLPNSGVRDDRTGLMYYSLLDAQLDAVYSAMAALGYGNAVTPTSTVGASLQSRGGRRIAVKDTGFPSRGGRPRRSPQVAGAAGGMVNASLAEDVGTSIENAQAYNDNLVRRIRSGRTGTPLHPGADLDVYVFSLFNDNLKQGPESERNFRLFYPDGRPVYDVQFRQGSSSWCVAVVGRERMQAARDWACSQGGADCWLIQPGAACYEPNTVEAHASYAMNSYYQRRGRDAGACNFNGVGRVVFQRPISGLQEEEPGSLVEPPVDDEFDYSDFY